VRSEQLYFWHCLWEGDFGGVKQGIAIYMGPATDQTVVDSCKFDYANTNPTHRILVLDDTRLFQLTHSTVSGGTISGAAAVIEVTGTALNPSFEWFIADNPALVSSVSIPVIRIDQAKWGEIANNTVTSQTSGHAGMLSFTANSFDNTTIGNFSLRNTDVLVVDSGARNLHLNRRAFESAYRVTALEVGDPTAIVASVGQIRLANGIAGRIIGRNAANTGDIGIILLDSNDHVQLGGPLRLSAANAFIEITDGITAPGSGTGSRLYIDTVDGDLKMVFAGGIVRKITDDAGAPAYTVANHSDDRALDETADTLAQVANVLGTLINDLKIRGALS
jgi:hypothetical protein